MKKIILILILCLFSVNGCAFLGGEREYDMRYAVKKALKAARKQKYIDAIAICDELIKKYEVEGFKEANLSRFKDKIPEDIIKGYGRQYYRVIEDISTAYLIKGNNYEKIGQWGSAVATYFLIIDYYPYVTRLKCKGCPYSVSEKAKARIERIYSQHYSDLSQEHISEIEKRNLFIKNL